MFYVGVKRRKSMFWNEMNKYLTRVFAKVDKSFDMRLKIPFLDFQKANFYVFWRLKIKKLWNAYCV
jgi:hypothetical protein